MREKYARLGVFLGHHYIKGLAANFIMLAVFAIAFPRTDLHSPWFYVMNVPILILIWQLMHGMRTHDFYLCERCAQETPLDGTAAAEEKDRVLRYQHSKWCVGLLLISIVGMFVLITFLPKAKTSGAIAFQEIPILFTTYMTALTHYVHHIHRVLYPWCKYCNHGKGRGDGGFMLNPVPSDPKVKQPV